MNENLAKFTRV